MNIKSIKKVIDGLPISGDTIIEIRNNIAIYESGAEFELKPDTRIAVGDVVKSVYHEFDETNEELFVGIDHKTSNGEGFVDGNRYTEVIKAERIRKIDILLNL